MKYPQAYFRVDHGEKIGDGHLFRDKALAAKMKEMGFDPIFVTRPREGYNPQKFLPYKVLTLDIFLKSKNDSAPRCEWLGVTEKKDVAECLNIVGNTKGNVWIVDHYGISVEWEKEMILQGQFLVSIDDLFRVHHSNMILDHNLTAEKNRYTSTYPNTTFLMGTRYALLRDDICRAREYVFNEEKKSHLLFLGSVEDRLFYKLLSVLREFNLEKLILLNPPKDFQATKNEEILSFCNDLPKLYEKQKIVFGSCGVAHLERMVLGVPTVTCVIVDNQNEVGRRTDELGVSYHLGDLRDLSSDELKRKIGEVIYSPILLRDKVEKGKNIISKNGAELVVKEIQNKLKEWQSH